MTLYARLEKDTVVELFETDLDIKDLFNPALIWVIANSDVVCGDLYANGIFSKAEQQTPRHTKEEVENFRLLSYADPIYGCDRYFAEVMSLQAEGFAASSTEVKDAKAKGLARKQELQALYPWPAE